jgi:hypothetical protein
MESLSTELRPPEETLTLSVVEAQYQSRLSHAHLYRAMESGELRYIQMARHRLILRSSLVEYLDRLAAQPKARRR